ncbi:TOTE conflict system archaeo-eukaryotic primase domain-containing protein [Puniceibacterium antarcticum]|uniref:TOTE conflict system archaeo-eukaryotic primase domain-containing protein n=1 Tax=Puniceibacterium antarcticum TaxID=1206336 RepID=UPI001C557304|nr:hypothetical protein [Puniceibacterium antarcticum]
MLEPTERNGWVLRLNDQSEIAADLAQVRQRLASLEAERRELQRQIAALEVRLASKERSSVQQPGFGIAPITNNSTSREKVKLFRRLFAGRPDVFPTRWENKKTGRSGYSPACANEWVKGICGKPKVKCGECGHQKFIPPDESIIEKHLRGDDGRNGDFVAGVYPLLPGDTCWFLAADFDKASPPVNPEIIRSAKFCQRSARPDRQFGNAMLLIRQCRWGFCESKLYRYN